MTFKTPMPINVAISTLPRIGQPIPNGAILLKEVELRRFEFRIDYLIFCVQDSRVTPFVSWIRTVTSDSPLATGGFHIVDTTGYGDYYHEKDIVDALAKFEKRVEQKLGMFSLDGELRV